MLSGTEVGVGERQASELRILEIEMSEGVGEEGAVAGIAAGAEVVDIF